MKSTAFNILRLIRSFFNESGLGKIDFVRNSYNYFFEKLRPSGMSIISLHGFVMLIDADEVGMAPQLLEKGVYEPFETNLVKDTLKPGDTVINIGANFGYYTLLAAKLVGPEGKVFAFEPEPKNFSLLEGNIKRNNIQNVEISNQAVSNEDNITLNLYTDEKNVGNPSLSEKNIPNLKGLVEVKTVTLSTFFSDRPDILKINLIQMDTQGSEGNIIKGSTSLIEKFHPTIIMEFWPYGLSNLNSEPVALLETLEKIGYTRFVIDEKTNSLNLMSAKDIIDLCISQKKGKGFVNLLLQYEQGSSV